MANYAWKSLSRAGHAEKSMTVEGAISKTGILVCLLCASGAFAYVEQSMKLFGIGLIGGLILALIIILRPRLAPILAPVYALTEGLMLGTVSQLVDAKYSGTATTAIVATIGTLITTLAVYRILGFHQRALSKKFVRGIFLATAGLACFYLLTLILNMFGIATPYMHEGGTMGILICSAAIGLAVFNLIIDFDYIRQGVEDEAPKQFEWYAGFGLVLTLVWLYIEILRLVKYINGN